MFDGILFANVQTTGAAWGMLQIVEQLAAQWTPDIVRRLDLARSRGIDIYPAIRELWRTHAPDDTSIFRDEDWQKAGASSILASGGECNARQASDQDACLRLMLRALLPSVTIVLAPGLSDHDRRDIDALANRKCAAAVLHAYGSRKCTSKFVILRKRLRAAAWQMLRKASDLNLSRWRLIRKRDVQTTVVRGMHPPTGLQEDHVSGERTLRQWNSLAMHDLLDSTSKTEYGS